MEAVKKLLDRIDLEYPKLRSAKQKYESGDMEGCMDEVIRHFAERNSPEYLFEKEEMKKLKDNKILEEAEEVLNLNLYGHQFIDEIDWNFNPTIESSQDNEWSWTLFRTLQWQTLARAYVMTGDERYTHGFISQLKSFAKSWPVEKFEEYEKSATPKLKYPSHPWRTIEAGIRIYTTWLPCYIAFRSSDCWDREGWVVYLGMLCDHADFLVTHYSNHKSSSNWLTMESSALLQMGILFPEMKNSDIWFNTGYRRVMHELKYSFDNDGVHIERTPIYHMVSSIAFLQAWELCVKNNIPVPPYGFPILEKAAEFIMKLVKPDFSTPMIGDADRNDLTARRSDTSPYEGMNLSFYPEDLNEMRAYFRNMYSLTGREDFLYFASGRSKGAPPKQRNYALVNQGIYIMRTGWDKRDSYFHVHGVQLERGERSTHSHNDQLHFELHIKGEDILIDSGRYIYNSSCWKNWRHYFLSASAHNTVYIDDHEMGTVPGVERVRGVRTYCHRFEETKDYSIIDLSHNGYVFTDDPIFHRRRIIRTGNDVYIVDDQLTGLGKREHDIRVYFNFAPGELKNTGGNNFQFTAQSGEKYDFISLINDGVSSVFLKGSEDPIGGWVSYGYSVRSPIPQIYLSSKGPVPLRFVSVIAPDGVNVDGYADINMVVLEIRGTGKIILSGENIRIEK
jgi:hypothetical protein